MLVFLRKALIAVSAAMASVPAAAQGADEITVFAAASLSNAVQAVAQSYQAHSGIKIVLSFAGSSVLARQIEASSGVDIFISADTAWMDYLEERDLIAPVTRTDLLGNRLVLVAPADSDIALGISRGFALAGALGSGRLALANTQTVPAGRYARASLMALGVWESVAAKLAEGEDVRAALAYVARGEAPLGIVYATDARIALSVRVVGTFPATSHSPIVYPVAMTQDAKPQAAAFLAFLKGPEARRVFEAAGFIPPRTQSAP